MDLLTAVAASMLPASRRAVAIAFKALEGEEGAGVAFLDVLWAAAGQAGPPPGTARLLGAAHTAIETGGRAGIHPIPLFDPAYPPLLKEVHDPPPVLWTRGVADVLPLPGVAIVGSRAATPYALQIAARLAAELVRAGVVVVSGLARGVDSAAHRGSLDAGGWTVAVLGSGVDRVYPPEHLELAGRVARSGVVISELAPGAPPRPEHFPLRNRIISGISLATVVVEASERSGSLITARCALEQGREVMAVPGSVLSGRNRGSHALLKDGAKVVETAEDILQEIALSSSAVAEGAPSGARASDPVLARMEPGEQYELEALVGRTGLDAAELLSRLTELELSGLVFASGGRFFRR